MRKGKRGAERTVNLRADTEKVEMSLEEIPIFHRKSAQIGKTLIILGNLKKSNADFLQEKECAGHICRVISPEKTFDEATVIREDGLVFTICLKAFESVKEIKIKNRRILNAK